MGDGADVEREWTGSRTRRPKELRTDRPHAARVYDVLLGGKTNYAADREAAAALEAAMPIARRTATANRRFMHRAVEFLAREHGIRQFLDIGTGIPTQPNLHETAQSVRPEARVVYADNDPIVLAHSRALHEGTPQGRTAYVHGDLREPTSILRDEETLATLEPGEPVAVTLLTVLHWLPDSSDPHAIVREVMAAVPPGSFLVISHITVDHESTAVTAASEGLNARGSQTTPRRHDQVLRFFDGLDLVPPGLSLVDDWRPPTHPAGVPDLTTPPTDAPTVPLYAGVAHKP